MHLATINTAPNRYVKCLPALITAPIAFQLLDVIMLNEEMTPKPVDGRLLRVITSRSAEGHQYLNRWENKFHNSWLSFLSLFFFLETGYCLHDANEQSTFQKCICFQWPSTLLQCLGYWLPEANFFYTPNFTVTLQIFTRLAFALSDHKHTVRLARGRTQSTTIEERP